MLALLSNMPMPPTVGAAHMTGVMWMPTRRLTVSRPADGPVARIAEMAVPVPFHAFFGVVLMMASTVMVSYYAAPMRGMDAAALTDQQTAGGIAWGFTELPTLLIPLVLFLQWQRSDARRTAAAGRHAARFGDVELDEYNARLQDLARGDAAR